MADSDDGDINVTITSKLRDGESQVETVITCTKTHPKTEQAEVEMKLTIHSVETGDPRASEIRARALTAAAELLSRLALMLHD